MLYLLSQMFVALAFAVIGGIALGWMLHRHRVASDADELHGVIERQRRKLSQSETDLKLLSDDFDDLSRQHREEHARLVDENRALPELRQNLERSQLLMRQTLAQHESEQAALQAEIHTLKQRLKSLSASNAERARAREMGQSTNESKAGDPLTTAEPTRTTDSARSAVQAEPLGRAEATEQPERSEQAEQAEPPRQTKLAEPVDEAERAKPGRPAEADTGTVAGSGVPIVTDRDTAIVLPEVALPEVVLSSVDVPNSSDVVEASTAAVTTMPEAADTTTVDVTIREAALIDRSTTDITSADLSAAAVAIPDVADAAERGAPPDSIERSGSWASRRRVDVPLAAAAVRDAAPRGNAPDVSSKSADEPVARAESPRPIRASGDRRATSTWRSARVSPLTTNAGEPDDDADPLFEPVDQIDDLQQIVGIGPITERALNRLGITSYSQLAELKEHDIERLADALEIRTSRIRHDDWVGAARRQLEDVLEDL